MKMETGQEMIALGVNCLPRSLIMTADAKLWIRKNDERVSEAEEKRCVVTYSIVLANAVGGPLMYTTCAPQAVTHALLQLPRL